MTRRAMTLLIVAGLLVMACSSSDDGGEAGSSTTAHGLESTDDAPGASTGRGSGAAPLAELPPADPSQGPGYLDWSTCRPAVVSLCTTLTVPLDHADPDGATIALAVELVPAADPEARQGVLWWNPGGPGMPGVSGSGGVAALVPQVLRNHYDIATFDPRGISKSSPVDCGPEPDTEGLDLSPDDAAEVQRILEVGREHAESCAANSPGLLAHLGTQSVARDLDLLRQAVGDEELHYIGMSYGTVIGQQYLALFPENAGRIVLDGVVDAGVDWEQRWTDMAQGRELAFERFLSWCASDPDCEFHSDGDPATAFASLYAALDSDPIVLEDDTIDQPSLEGELSQALYGGEAGWNNIAYSLALLRDRNVACLSDLECRLRLDPLGNEDELSSDPGDVSIFDGEIDDEFNEPYADGLTNRSFAFDAVTCIDWPMPRDPVAFEVAAARISAAAPTFGRVLSWAQAPCIYWGADPVGLLSPAPGAASVLVVSTTHDPATPLKHAQAVAARLGAPLVTVDSARHVIFPSGAGCPDDLVTAFMIDGTIPSTPETCPMP